MGSTIDQVLQRARRRLTRVSPQQAAAEQADGALLVDTRTETQRAKQGEIPGALVIDRSVFEWRLDPTSPSRIPEAKDHQTRVIVICSEGYSSSLAAASPGSTLSRRPRSRHRARCWSTLGPKASAPNRVRFPAPS